MPKSRVRKEAANKLAFKKRGSDIEAAEAKVAKISDRSWVPYVFVPLGLLGVLWLVVFYIAGQHIPFMRAMADWNLLVGLGLMASAFVVSTFWK